MNVKLQACSSVFLSVAMIFDPVMGEKMFVIGALWRSFDLIMPSM
jgi:hypothetical protein